MLQFTEFLKKNPFYYIKMFDFDEIIIPLIFILQTPALFLVLLPAGTCISFCNLLRVMEELRGLINCRANSRFWQIKFRVFSLFVAELRSF